MARPRKKRYALMYEEWSSLPVQVGSAHATYEAAIRARNRFVEDQRARGNREFDTFIKEV